MLYDGSVSEEPKASADVCVWKRAVMHLPPSQILYIMFSLGGDERTYSRFGVGIYYITSVPCMWYQEAGIGS